MSSFFYRLANGFTSSLPLHFHWIRSSLPSPVPASTRHAIFASTIAVLLCFIQMKYENKNFTPFDTHPKTMNVSIFSLLLYCISSMAEATLNRAIFVLVCGHNSDVLAALLVALLASIILPVPLRLLGYIVFMYIMVRVFLALLPIGWLKQWVIEKARKLAVLACLPMFLLQMFPVNTRL